MPKTFTKHERELIHTSMLKVGSSLLRTKGIRQVTVEDITKGVNIAKGSFYSFYQSREELFWDIIKSEEKQMLDQIRFTASQEIEIKTKIRKIFYEVYLKEDSIVFHLTEKDIEYISRKLPPELLQEDKNKAYDMLKTILSLCHYEESEEVVEILIMMIQTLRFISSSDIPRTEACRKKILGIFVEAIVEHLSGGNIN